MKRTYYKVEIFLTAKEIGKKNQEYSAFGSIEEVFATLQEAKNYLKERYCGKRPKSQIYVDDREGNSLHIGWIFGYKNRDVSHDSKWWWQEDWVEMKKVTEQPVT